MGSQFDLSVQFPLAIFFVSGVSAEMVVVHAVNTLVGRFPPSPTPSKGKCSVLKGINAVMSLITYFDRDTHPLFSTNQKIVVSNRLNSYLPQHSGRSLVTEKKVNQDHHNGVSTGRESHGASELTHVEHHKQWPTIYSTTGSNSFGGVYLGSHEKTARSLGHQFMNGIQSIGSEVVGVDNIRILTAHSPRRLRSMYMAHFGSSCHRFTPHGVHYCLES